MKQRRAQALARVQGADPVTATGEVTDDNQPIYKHVAFAGKGYGKSTTAEAEKDAVPYSVLQRLGAQVDILPVGTGRVLLENMHTYMSQKHKKEFTTWRVFKRPDTSRKMQIALGFLNRM